MILRFCSGSVTPARRERKRSSASTATSGTLKTSRKALTTCSPSFLRIRPWSTNTHVSWSPTALWVSSAATLESTPPESPQITWPSPTWARIRSICSSAIEAADQSIERPQMSRRKVSRICVPYGVCTTSGWNWIPYRPLSRCSRAATGDSVDDASAVKPGGASKTVSRWLIQQDCSAGRPASRRPGSATFSCERPNSPTSAPSTRPPSSSTMACIP